MQGHGSVLFPRQMSLLKLSEFEQSSKLSLAMKSSIPKVGK